MAIVTILNGKFIENGLGVFNNWTIGANNAWTASDYAPQINGVDGLFSIAGAGNTLSQANVFPDYTGNTQHTIKVNATVVGTTAVAVLFGTATAGTITTTGVQYFTATAATNSTLAFDIRSGLVSIDYVTDVTNIDIVSMTGANSTFIAPVYNPIYFNITSTNTAQANYRYVFDVYTGITATGVSQARVKLLPRPGGSANCIFSPARILESYLSYDIRIQNIVQPTNSVRHFTPYTIRFGEEYGSLTTGVTIYSALTYFSGYTFNGVLQYDQIPSWNYITYLNSVGSSGTNFLTNQPTTGVYIKNTTDRGTLSFMQVSSAITKMLLTTYQNSGGTKTYFLANTGITQNNVVHIPSGIWNLNNLPNSAATINISTDYKYTIEGYTTSVVTDPVTYLIDDRCSKYSTVRMQFLNRLGGFDYFNFNLVSRKSLTIKRDTYRKVLDYNYQLGDRGETILDIDGGYSYKVNSDWVSDEESVWLEELMTSPEVYVIGSDGIASPIIIDDTVYDVKKSLNDKLFNYTISYRLASKLNSQRG